MVFDDHAAWRVPVLWAFLVVLPTLLPDLLRFITFRIGPLRDEYVYNLHRLGVDSPEHLAEPPRSSKAWVGWYDSGGRLLRGVPDIYRAKFAAQYGRRAASHNDVHREGLGRLMSAYLCLVAASTSRARSPSAPGTRACGRSSAGRTSTTTANCWEHSA